MPVVHQWIPAFAGMTSGMEFSGFPVLQVYLKFASYQTQTLKAGSPSSAGSLYSLVNIDRFFYCVFMGTWP